MIIDGKEVTTDTTFEITDPWDGSTVGYAPVSNYAHVKAAVSSSVRSFKDLCRKSPRERYEILLRIMEDIEGQKRDIAMTITREAGKPIKYSMGEVMRCLETLLFSAEAALDLHGETVPVDATKGGKNDIAFYARFPAGPVCAITPFNFPLNLAVHKLAPAIAAGNSTVFKPSSYTPLTGYILTRIANDHLPAGCLNVVYGPGASIGRWLIESPEIRFITFTGSAQVGRWIQSHARCPKIALELGSNSACIVSQSADMERAVDRCVYGAFVYSGQVCISLQRLLVHSSIYEDFLDLLIERTKSLRIGDPKESVTDIGPMISEKEAVRVQEWVDQAVENGAEVLCGGERRNAIYIPTVLTGAGPGMKVWDMEVFGPVVCVKGYDDLAEAIETVNRSEYGLNAGIFTSDLREALNAYKGLECGAVIVNDVPTYRADNMPYGGVKGSGVGREGPRFAIEEMTYRKLVVFRR